MGLQENPLREVHVFEDGKVHIQKADALNRLASHVYIENTKENRKSTAGPIPLSQLLAVTATEKTVHATVVEIVNGEAKLRSIGMDQLNFRLIDAESDEDHIKRSGEKRKACARAKGIHCKESHIIHESDLPVRNGEKMFRDSWRWREGKIVIDEASARENAYKVIDLHYKGFSDEGEEKKEEASKMTLEELHDLVLKFLRSPSPRMLRI